MINFANALEKFTNYFLYRISEIKSMVVIIIIFIRYCDKNFHVSYLAFDDGGPDFLGGFFVPRGLQSGGGVWRARCSVERNEQEKEQS